MFTSNIKKILIDIKHPAQLNLFKRVSTQLRALHWDVTIAYLDRGKLPGIIKREYAGFKTIAVGSSRGTKWSILWNGNIARTFTFMDLMKENHYDICVAASSVPLAVAGMLSGIPVIQFYDDPERRLLNGINATLSKQIFFPPIVKSNSKVSVFNCLKEWSYLSPAYFTPDESIPKRYGVTAGEYIFAREVSNKSFNYFKQQDAIICGLAGEIDASLPVLLSLEDKTLRESFPSNWTILEEPVDDIHSLMYYSRLVISSGDSMAREGALLGTQSIYCGTREMKANKLLTDRGFLQHVPGRQAIAAINGAISRDWSLASKNRIRRELQESWDDMNLFMLNQMNTYSN